LGKLSGGYFSFLGGFWNDSAVLQCSVDKETCVSEHPSVRTVLRKTENYQVSTEGLLWPCYEQCLFDADERVVLAALKGARLLVSSSTPACQNGTSTGAPPSTSALVSPIRFASLRQNALPLLMHPREEIRAAARALVVSAVGTEDLVGFHAFWLTALRQYLVSEKKIEADFLAVSTGGGSERADGAQKLDELPMEQSFRSACDGAGVSEEVVILPPVLYYEPKDLHTAVWRPHVNRATYRKLLLVLFWFGAVLFVVCRASTRYGPLVVCEKGFLPRVLKFGNKKTAPRRGPLAGTSTRRSRRRRSIYCDR